MNTEYPKNLIALCNNLPPRDLQKFINLSTKALEVDKLSLDEVSDYVPSNEVCLDLLGIFIQIVDGFNRGNVQDYYKELFAAGFKEEFIEHIISEIPRLHFTPKSLEINKVINIKWRIDLSFCDSQALQKIPVPIIICFVTKNGRHTFEMTKSVFNLLRFAVAIMMKKIIAIKNINEIKQ